MIFNISSINSGKMHSIYKPVFKLCLFKQHESCPPTQNVVCNKRIFGCYLQMIWDLSLSSCHRFRFRSVITPHLSLPVLFSPRLFLYLLICHFLKLYSWHHQLKDYHEDPLPLTFTVLTGEWLWYWWAILKLSELLLFNFNEFHWVWKQKKNM